MAPGNYRCSTPHHRWMDCPFKVIRCFITGEESRCERFIRCEVISTRRWGTTQWIRKWRWVNEEQFIKKSFFIIASEERVLRGVKMIILVRDRPANQLATWYEPLPRISPHLSPLANVVRHYSLVPRILLMTIIPYSTIISIIIPYFET